MGGCVCFWVIRREFGVGGGLRGAEEIKKWVVDMCSLGEGWIAIAWGPWAASWWVGV